MLSLETGLIFVATSILLALVPGPDNLFVLAQSALKGRAAGLAITLGLCTGLIFHTLIVAFGLSTLFMASPLAYMVLKITGAAYLLFLAWKSFRACPESIEVGAQAGRAALKLYSQGVLMNLTNPKVIIFFLAFLPQFTVPARGYLAQQLLVLGGLFIACAWLTFSGIALMASRLSAWLRQSPGAQVMLNRVAGIVFVLLAGSLVLSHP